MASLVGTYLPLFYMLVFFLAVSMCVATDMWKAAFYLTSLYLIAWVDSIWFNPITHMLTNLLIFSMIIFTFNSRVGTSFWILTFCMVLTNGVFAITEASDFYRLSIINILFFILCLIATAASYNARHTHGNKQKKNSVLFMARAED